MLEGEKLQWKCLKQRFDPYIIYNMYFLNQRISFLVHK